MRFSIVFILLSVLLTNSSCKKGKADLVINGTIVDATFGTPLSGVKLNLYELQLNDPNPDVLVSTTTNSEGKYSLTFPRNQVESYRLEGIKDLYFNIDESISFSDLSIEYDNTRLYATYAKSWVALRFINQSPLPSDVLKFTKQEGKSGCDGCCPDGEQQLIGAIDTTIYYPNNGNTVFSYSYVDINTSQNGVKSATTLAFDTTEIQLNY